MKKVLMLVLVGLFALSACGSSGGEGVEASAFWVRAALKDGNSAAYMVLQNHDGMEDALIGASSDVANAVEIHLSQMNADGTMQMLQQEAIALSGNGELELKPGSYHVMLIGLKQDLNVGDEVTLTLHFKNHAGITLTIPVKDAADMGGSGMDGHGNGMP